MTPHPARGWSNQQGDKGKKGETLNPRAVRTVPIEDLDIPIRKFEFVAEDNHQRSKDPSSRDSLSLQFVRESGTARPRGTSRNLIRSHARRNKPRGSSVLELGPTERDAGAVKLDSTSQSRRAKSSDRPPAECHELVRLVVPGGGVLEPFDAMPVRPNKHMQALLTHWDTVFRHSYAPASPRDKWLELAIIDPATLNSTLFVTALNLVGLHGKPLSPDVFYFKGETIRIINKRLGDRTQAVLDTTICAVASLANLENLAGTPASAKVHMDGLEAMVGSRGGLRQLGAYGLARRISVWGDSCAAILLMTKPRFDDIGIDVDFPPDWVSQTALSVQYQVQLFRLTGSLLLSHETVGIYLEFRHLSALKDSGRLGSNLDGIAHNDIVELLERRLIAIIQDESLIYPTPALSIYLLFAYAAIIHSYVFVHDLSRGLPFVNLMSRRIREFLENVDISQLTAPYPEMMLWVFIMAGIGGNDASELHWFAKLVAQLCLKLGIHGGAQIASMLEDFIWSKLYRSPMTMMFWNEVARFEGFKGSYEVKKLADHVAVAIFNAPPAIGGS